MEEGKREGSYSEAKWKEPGIESKKRSRFSRRIAVNKQGRVMDAEFGGFRIPSVDPLGVHSLKGFMALIQVQRKTGDTPLLDNLSAGSSVG